MKKFIGWFGGFWEDANGKASRKSIALYTCLFFLGDIVMKEKTPDLYVLVLLALITLFTLGAITREQVGKVIEKSQEKKQ